ncbi:hypothetical protein PHLCEN_2v5385, partial [Hermanssonia centrifuga]
QIEYIGPWYPLTSLNSSTHNGTITGVNRPGAFSLTFFGSHVSVWGTLRGMNYTLPTPTESSYSIDGVVNPNYTALQGTEEIDNVLFFDSGDIGTSIHKIIVTVISATPSFPYYLDYITVVSPTNSTSTALSQITIISTTTLLQPATLSQIPVTYTASDIPSQSTVSSLRPNSTSSHVAVGAIVGDGMPGSGREWSILTVQMKWCHLRHLENTMRPLIPITNMRAKPLCQWSAVLPSKRAASQAFKKSCGTMIPMNHYRIRD